MDLRIEISTFPPNLENFVVGCIVKGLSRVNSKSEAMSIYEELETNKDYTFTVLLTEKKQEILFWGMNDYYLQIFIENYCVVVLSNRSIYSPSLAASSQSSKH